MTAQVVRLGTRGSALALAQSSQVAVALEAGTAGLRVELVTIRTSGDQLQQGSLAAVGGKGLFVKELEEALVAGAVDLAVHSMKDVPGQLDPRLVIAAIPPRADPRDVLVSRVTAIDELAPGARVGTASVRRRAQLLGRRRDLDVQVLRGNVDTRLRRWRDGDFDAIVLAAAGLARLGIDEPAARPLAIDQFLPAVGQGALALECRADDAATRAILARVDHGPSALALAAERAFLHAIGGDCNTPLAAHATEAAGHLFLRAQVCDLDGARAIEDEEHGASSKAEVVGRVVAERLLARGAGELIRR